jgi:hypothetical protein
MTTFKTNFIIAAATLMVAAGSASAQTLKAEIPFAFRVGNTVMPAGTYQLKSQQAPAVYRLSALQGKSILVLPSAAHDAKKSWSNPTLAFECGSNLCSLSEVWTGPGSAAYKIPMGKADRNEATHTALVAMKSDKGD